MRFNIAPYSASFKPNSSFDSQFWLVEDNWDDFGFETIFSLWYVDPSRQSTHVGQVKIAKFGARKPYMTRLDLTVREGFDSLGKDYYSLGQGESYYERLQMLGDDVRKEALSALSDVAYDQELFGRARYEQAMTSSMLRTLDAQQVMGPLKRLAAGKHKHIGYQFTYRGPARNPSFKMKFEVIPDSSPPTNINVVIGSNGVGKTTLLTEMTKALVLEDSSEEENGSFTFEKTDDESIQKFARIVSITFSAFDPFAPIEPTAASKDRRYFYIGLKKLRENDSILAEAFLYDTKLPSELAEEFGESMYDIISSHELRERWIATFESVADTFFPETRLRELCIWDPISRVEKEEFQLKENSFEIFKSLSAGHQIFVLSVTRLVEKLTESTLVLIDEPEAHLHPPFLSALIRCLSNLLAITNGVAIIATHSPVVLQEAPRKCVYNLQRFGDSKNVFPPKIETFGENVGILTNDVFQLEIQKSGFYKLMRDAVSTLQNYEGVVAKFDGQLGGEARALVRAILHELSGQTRDDA